MIVSAQVTTIPGPREDRGRPRLPLDEASLAAYEAVACGVLVQAPGGEVLHANRVAEEILGVGLAAMAGRGPDGLWGAGPGERPFEQAARTGWPVRGAALEVVRPDGSRRWLEVDSVPLAGPGGKLTHIVSSLVDVSARREAEEALRESEDRFRAVFDAGAMGIVRLALDGTVIGANAAFLRFLGRTPGELDGTAFSDCLDPEDAGGVRLGEVLEGGRDQCQAEILYRRRDGQAAWGNTLASLVRDDKGAPAFVLTMVEDVGDRKAQEAALEHQALHDALTDLPNRTLLHDRLQQALLGAQREGGTVALLLMDLDRFKEVNDSFGHHLGDLLLQQVALRLRGDLRGSDTVARLGGDEFAMILPGVEDESGAGLAARKILKSLEEPFELEPEVLHVGGSIGISLYPGHGLDAETLLRRADIAMYVAKRGGTGFALYRADDDTNSPGRLALLGELRQAVQRGELTLHYQPKVDLRTGRVAGLEALVRWQHPSHGLMLPDQFIPLAEDTGLTGPLGLWVVDAALAQSRQWADSGLEIPVAVNVSARSLGDARLPETVGWMLDRHRVNPAMLRVEVTESTLMADPERAMEILTALAEMGLGITLDDFGTGYSSLAYLGRLPADELKIARPFVMDMDVVENARVIVRSIIDLGHSLGLMVVGEGVETAHAMAALEAASCDMVQGFHVSRPLPASDLAAWLDRPQPRTALKRT
ncbi:MAG: putative bifunctional diguanylate cyclase/phosphodiesterase [Candidatus Dormibacterales bacterium]